jgi:CheY-like chemotaxis protein
MNQPQIFILDDDPEFLSLLNDIVKDMGLVAECFNRGQIFIEQAKHIEKGALLILDLMMPDMDGIEVMNNLVELPNPPALILMSGHSKEILYTAKKLGIAYKLNIITSITKPISLSEVQKLVKGYCDGLNNIGFGSK